LPGGRPGEHDTAFARAHRPGLRRPSVR
jgi:hypothetical protein